MMKYLKHSIYKYKCITCIETNKKAYHVIIDQYCFEIYTFCSFRNNGTN